jgi:hypothetical protein
MSINMRIRFQLIPFHFVSGSSFSLAGRACKLAKRKTQPQELKLLPHKKRKLKAIALPLSAFYLGLQIVIISFSFKNLVYIYKKQVLSFFYVQF